MKLKYKPSQVRKALVALATAITQGLALGLVPEPWDKYSVLVLAVLGCYGVFAMGNGRLPE